MSVAPMGKALTRRYKGKGIKTLYSKHRVFRLAEGANETFVVFFHVLVEFTVSPSTKSVSKIF